MGRGCGLVRSALVPLHLTVRCYTPPNVRSAGPHSHFFCKTCISRTDCPTTACSSCCSTIEAVPVGRIFLRLVDLLPLPSLRVQRVIAAAVILSQGGIAVTGAIVRVTASGLGCPTWPQCFPGSFTPIPHPEVAGIHQAVEFGNRMITFLVVADRRAGGAGGHACPQAPRGADLRVADAGIDGGSGGDRRHHGAHRPAVVDRCHPPARLDDDGVGIGAALRQDR